MVDVADPETAVLVWEVRGRPFSVEIFLDDDLEESVDEKVEADTVFKSQENIADDLKGKVHGTVNQSRRSWIGGWIDACHWWPLILDR